MSTDLSNEIARFMIRDLEALRRELEAYPNDESVWSLPPGAPNSAGTLALHMAGNLQHYVGALLGGTDYVRDRDAEFATRDVPRRGLIDEVEKAQRAIRATLFALEESVLERPFPEVMRGVTLSTREVLVLLAIHLGYHLGQVDYHRRLITGDATGIDALSPVGLRSFDPA